MSEEGVLEEKRRRLSVFILAGFQQRRWKRIRAAMNAAERRESNTARATKFLDMGFEERGWRGREEMFAGKVMATVGGGGGGGGEMGSGKNGLCVVENGCLSC